MNIFRIIRAWLDAELHLMWGHNFSICIWSVVYLQLMYFNFVHQMAVHLQSTYHSVMPVTRHAHIKMNLSTVSGSGMRGQEDKFYSASAWKCWWAPLALETYLNSWPMDKLQNTFQVFLGPSLTILSFTTYASFCDHFVNLGLLS